MRVPEHQGVLRRTGKHLEQTYSTSVRDHMLVCNYLVAWDDYQVMGRECNYCLLKIKESLFTKGIVETIHRPFFFYLLLNVSQHKF